MGRAGALAAPLFSRLDTWTRNMSFAGRAWLSFGVLFTLLLLLTGLKGNTGTGLGDGYESASVEPGTIQLSVRATGHIRAKDQQQIFSRVSGIVREVAVDYDASVKEGEVLAVLEDHDYRLSLDDAESSLTASRSELAGVRARVAHAEQEKTRAERLFKSDLIPRQELESATASVEELNAQLQMSEARVQQADARVSQARENLDRCQIRSPIAGVLLTINAEPGKPVSPGGMAPLFEVAPSLDALELKVAVTESDVGKVQPGQAVTFTVEAFPGEDFTGTVTALRRGGEEVNGVTYYEVVVEAANPVHRLLPGMTAQVSIDAGSREVELMIPLKALLFNPDDRQLKPWQEEINRIRQRGDTLVWVTEGRGKLRPEGVQLGMQDTDHVEILGAWEDPEAKVIYRP